MDCVATRFFIRQITITDYRIFVLADHARSLNFINKDYYCLEFDRDSLMLVTAHKDVYKVKMNNTGKNTQYVLL